MRHVVASCTLLLVACGGMDEAEFANTYAADWCQHRLSCEDPGQLTFEGITTVEDCSARMIQDVAGWGDGCMYDGKQAEVCLADLEALTCPADGGLGDPPVSCNTVYVQCPASTDTDAS